MRTQSIILCVVVTAFAQLACKDVECGDGTIERDGRCAPASTTTLVGTCGPFTELQGDRCVPQFPPTECDPSTTMPTTDPETGVTTCIGTGGGGCNAPFACPTPTDANRLTVCGQLYDFETNAKFQGTDPTGMMCDPAMPAASGPCALKITPYDAISFAMNPMGATPRPVDSVYIDDCGRYRLTNIDTSGTSPFIGLGIDDAGVPNAPSGVTVTVGVATPKASTVVSNFEAWIVKLSTVQMWGASGGPSLAGGIYVASYRKHKLAAGVDRHLPQEGVVFSNTTGTTFSADDYYFTAAQTTHQTIDGAAGVTGANGSVLVANRSVAEGVTFVGTGGIGAGCQWEPHAAVSLPGIVFIQLFRKVDLDGMAGSCTE